MIECRAVTVDRWAVTCDFCGNQKYLEGSEPFEAQIRDRGWLYLSIKEDYRNLCPECQELLSKAILCQPKQ